jgi:hypothetical protein
MGTLMWVMIPVICAVENQIYGSSAPQAGGPTFGPMSPAQQATYDAVVSDANKMH